LKRLNAPYVRWIFNCGEGSNTKDELVGPWEAFIMEKLLDIHHIQMLADSKMVIDLLERKGKLHATKIEGWKRRIWDLATKFQGTYFQHIFKESNEEVDKLSKQALEAPKGRLIYFN
jgi:ribonuclease HI